jgi:Sap, sulfolipid-1-addressing protein
VEPVYGPDNRLALVLPSLSAKNSHKPESPREASSEPTDNSKQGSVPAMWSGLLVPALLLAINPVLLGLVLLLISRPRPVQNVFVFWVGCLIVNVAVLLVPLTALHLIPAFASFAHDLATRATVASSTVSYIQIGVGVLMLTIAALMTVRLVVRQPAHLPTRGGNTSILVLDSNAPTAISRGPGRSQDAATESGSAIRRMGRRAQNAWENGSLWVALVLGMGYFVGPYLVLFVDTTIVASGAAIATQVSAAVAFVVGMLAVVEITLVGHLATPAKTEAVLRPLHDWALAHRRQVLMVMFAVIGLWQVAKGTGII